MAYGVRTTIIECDLLVDNALLEEVEEERRVRAASSEVLERRAIADERLSCEFMTVRTDGDDCDVPPR
jgi:hypothetical protein